MTPGFWSGKRVLITGHTGFKGSWLSPAQPIETHSLYLDSSKARKRLGWAPQLTLATALGWVVEWYRAYVRKNDMRAITTTQILRYQNLTRSSWTQIAAIARRR